MKVGVTCRAYAKILLHATKYPHKAVNGVLLAGKSSGDDDDDDVLHI